MVGVLYLEYRHEMDTICSGGIDCDATRSSLLNTIRHKFNEKTLLMIRQELFDKAKQKSLTHSNNKLVTRVRRACGPTIHDKLVKDDTELVYLIRNRLPIPRVLLKNGKRALGEFIDSRDKDAALAPISELPASPAPRDTTPAPVVPIDTHELDPVTPSIACSNAAAIISGSAAVEAIDEMAQGPTPANAVITVGGSALPTPTASMIATDLMHLQIDVKNLSNSVKSLASELAELVKSQQGNSYTNTPTTDPCFVYVRVVSQNLKEHLGKSALEEALHCRVIQYAVISDLPSLKVKIAKKDLFRALQSS